MIGRALNGVPKGEGSTGGRGWRLAIWHDVKVFFYNFGPDLPFLNNAKFTESILSKFVKIVATRYHIFRRKCTEFDFVWGSAVDPPRKLTVTRLLQII